MNIGNHFIRRHLNLMPSGKSSRGVLWIYGSFNLFCSVPLYCSGCKSNKKWSVISRVRRDGGGGEVERDKKCDDRKEEKENNTNKSEQKKVLFLLGKKWEMWHGEITEQTKWRGKNGVSRNKWRRKGDGIQEANVRKYKLQWFKHSPPVTKWSYYCLSLVRRRGDVF